VVKVSVQKLLVFSQMKVQKVVVSDIDAGM
jgi:hypothetical protein